MNISSTKPIIAVAPMMGYTDKHYRFFSRLFSSHIRLYTEMLSTQAILHGNKTHLLNFHPQEKYIALQLGGNDSKALQSCAQIAEDFGYDEVNLNVGCPSSKVKEGQFGACLMRDPQLVAEITHAMQSKVKIPVTVKCRLGIDNQNCDITLPYFIQLLNDAGCKTIIIHARKALLQGLSPKENREIPPLNYNLVYEIKNKFPHLQIILNGGIKSIEHIQHQINRVDGVMIGRAACFQPYLLAEIEAQIFGGKLATRLELIEKFIPYVHEQIKNKVRLTAMSRHLLGLFMYQPRAALWRRFLSEKCHQPHAGIEVLLQAIALMK